MTDDVRTYESREEARMEEEIVRKTVRFALSEGKIYAFRRNPPEIQKEFRTSYDRIKKIILEELRLSGEGEVHIHEPNCGAFERDFSSCQCQVESITFPEGAG